MMLQLLLSRRRSESIAGFNARIERGQWRLIFIVLLSSSRRAENVIASRRGRVGLAATIAHGTAEE